MTDVEQAVREMSNSVQYDAAGNPVYGTVDHDSGVVTRVVPSEGVLAEAAVNATGRQGDAQRGDGWDQIVADIQELLRNGSISESQAEVAVGSLWMGIQDPVLQRLRERYGQEQDAEACPDARSRGYCECNGVDDGTPMVKCDSGVFCSVQWFHVACIGMQEPGPRKGGKSVPLGGSDSETSG
jgi:hypothetical protein